jgi:NAD(P)-dependent dehydrogenase (short-subunit alcohol dehydrogenase family)
VTTSLHNAVVFVTGANGGLGLEFVKQSLERGAAKVYATARTPRTWDDSRIIPLALDVTNQASIDAAVAAASDTTIVINNAGIYSHVDSLTGGKIEDIREMFEVNFFGAIQVTRGFAPILGANGGGAFVNVHSVLSWWGAAGSYSAAKAAIWSASNSFRTELAPQGTHVLGLHIGYTDTPMMAGIDVAKNAPSVVVADTFDGLEAGEYEVLGDEASVNVKAALSGKIEDLYPQLARS